MKKLAAALILLLPLGLAVASPEQATVTSDKQVDIAVSVSPLPVGAGSDAAVTVRLDPKPGIKMNKYPKIKLTIPAVSGLVGESEQSLGNPAPPSADDLDANYFHGGVDPLKLSLHVDAAAPKGLHEIPAKLSYFYCVAASGYCAPAKLNVTIPVTVR